MLSGGEGCLESFWRETAANDPDFYRAHPVPQVIEDPAHCVPLGIYGDDSGLFVAQKFLVLLWGSVATAGKTLDSKLFFCAVSYLYLVPGKSLEMVYRVFHWSLTWLSLGEFPPFDHQGRWFCDSYYPHRAKLAGKRISKKGYVGAFSELRGDWKWQKEALKLRRHYGANDCCHLCMASRRALRRLYTMCTRNSRRATA